MLCNNFFLYVQPTFAFIATFINILSGIIAALGNTFCLIVLWQPSQRSKSNKILTSLAFSDCLVGYICYPLGIWLLHNGQQMSDQVCNVHRIHGFIVLWMACTSSCSIAFLAYDRFAHVTKSAQYHAIVTERNIYLVITLSWSLTFLLAVGNLFHNIVYVMLAPALLIISATILSKSYLLLYMENDRE